MLTTEEKNFIEYWKQNRDKQKKTIRQLLIGIPIGLLFAIPICLNFFSGWYKRAAMVRNTNDFNPVVLMIAMLIIIAFVAIFSKRHQWEMNEQKYQELNLKQSSESGENDQKTGSV